MANSKNFIAEQIERILAGGTPNEDFPITRNEIIAKIEQNSDTLTRIRLTRVLNGREGFSKGINGAYLKEYNLTPSRDTTSKFSFIQLPVRPIDLPYDQGVYNVRQIGNESDALDMLAPLVRLHPNQSLFRGLAEALPNKRDGFRVVGDKVILQFSDDTELSRNKMFKVTVVTSARSITADESLAIPGDLEAEVIALTLEEFRVMLGNPIDENSDMETKK